MIDPHLIFQKPIDYIDFLTSDNPEGQYFDRKEVRSNVKNGMRDTRKNIREAISAFTNSRGGLLILGISDVGGIEGLNHLNEQDYNSLVQMKNELTAHQTLTKEFTIEGKKMLAFYSPEGLSGICKTIEKSSRGWVRDGANNLPLTTDLEERLLLERNKKWEQLSVCEYDNFYIHHTIFESFKSRYLKEQDASFSYTDEEFAVNVGIAKRESGKTMFTNAGFLFIAKNPSAFIPSAQIRFLKYEIESADFQEAENPIFDKTFSGCLPVLLRKVRTLVNEGAFFKQYFYRIPKKSGIIEEPELPLNVVEEAIVNALIHRDYNIPLPIYCMLYKDAFVVKSPGPIKQPYFIPTHFDLDDQILIHYPRNPKISQWAKTIVDENGKRFVKLLSEGHRSMLQAMKNMNLPTPKYYTNAFTTVTLYNNYKEREAKMKNGR
ncbi:MAG: helix-turn-helix domain-containing protein [Chitinophagales bacterium]